MDVSVVIPAYNAEKTIEQCIKALLHQDFPKNRYEIIVVDDGSTDKTTNLVKAYPVRLVQQKHSGAATARNAGIKIAKGKIVAFTDADCAPKSDWLQTLVKNFVDPNVAGVGGAYETGNKESLLARTIGYEIKDKHERMPRLVDYIGSFNCAYRKRVLEEVGGFDESFRIASGEDNDLSYRIFRMGYKLRFDPNAIVVHNHPTRLSRYLKRQFQHAMWRVKLYRKHPDRVRGDCYAGVFPRIQLLAYGFLFLTAALSLFSPLARWVFVGLLVALFLSNLPFSFKLYRKSGDVASLLLLLMLSFLRGFAWMFGVMVGVAKFLVLGE